MSNIIKCKRVTGDATQRYYCIPDEVSAKSDDVFYFINGATGQMTFVRCLSVNRYIPDESIEFLGVLIELSLDGKATLEPFSKAKAVVEAPEQDNISLFDDDFKF